MKKGTIAAAGLIAAAAVFVSIAAMNVFGQEFAEAETSAEAAPAQEAAVSGATPAPTPEEVVQAILTASEASEEDIAAFQQFREQFTDPVEAIAAVAQKLAAESAAA